jgi:hypothetical protein
LNRSSITQKKTTKSQKINKTNKRKKKERKKKVKEKWKGNKTTHTYIATLEPTPARLLKPKETKKKQRSLKCEVKAIQSAMIFRIWILILECFYFIHSIN